MIMMDSLTHSPLSSFKWLRGRKLLKWQGVLRKLPGAKSPFEVTSPQSSLHGKAFMLTTEVRLLRVMHRQLFHGRTNGRWVLTWYKYKSKIWFSCWPHLSWRSKKIWGRFTPWAVIFQSLEYEARFPPKLGMHSLILLLLLFFSSWV